jgi:hypothetical protein
MRHKCLIVNNLALQVKSIYLAEQGWEKFGALTVPRSDENRKVSLQMFATRISLSVRL